MNAEILRFVDTIHRDRQIDKEIIFTGIEMALVSAVQKKFGTSDGIVVTIDRETGGIEATVDGTPLSPGDLGRIAALSGKQVLFQKIREAERDVIYREYKPKIGQLLTGTVQTKKPGGVLILSLQGAEGFLPRSEQSPAEAFNEGDRIKVVLSEVNLMPNRIQLLCSRSSPELVRRLFELEIPEVSDYVVEIKAIAREAGYRTKIAVTTYDPNVDCVGACVGVKGSRIRNIVDELFGEKIDIVRWNDSIEILIVEALRPAIIASLDLDFETKSALVYVTEDQQSLAIGRRGQNVRLASKLTGWELKITPVSEEDLRKMREEGMESLAEGLFSEGAAAAEGATEPTPSALDRLFTAEANSEEVAAEPEEEAAEQPTSTPSPPSPPSPLDKLFKPEDDLASVSGDSLTPDTGSETAPTRVGETAEVEDGARSEEKIIDAELAETTSPEADSGNGTPEGIEDPIARAGVSPSELKLEELPGVGSVMAERLREAGLDSRVKILEGGVDTLANVEGISESRARQILEYLMTTT